MEKAKYTVSTEDPWYWKPEQVKFLLKNWGKLSAAEIGKKIGKTMSACVNKKHILDQKAGQTKKLQAWNEEELQFLLNNWEKLTAREIGEKLGRTTDACFVKKYKTDKKLNKINPPRPMPWLQSVKLNFKG